MIIVRCEKEWMWTSPVPPKWPVRNSEYLLVESRWKQEKKLNVCMPHVGDYAFYHQGVSTYPFYVYVRLCRQPSDFIIVKYKQWWSFRSNKYSNKSWCIYFRAGTISKVLESDRWRKHKILSHLNEDHLSPSIRSWTRISPPHSLSNQKTKEVVGEYPRL